ncbi:hypothetical protein C8R44DRAFT_746687 [Mycena epipterygia]|nr:hypothetical protein C8R44DRAFT_746687 [Mycena epipterygia]
MYRNKQPAARKNNSTFLSLSHPVYTLLLLFPKNLARLEMIWTCQTGYMRGRAMVAKPSKKSTVDLSSFQPNQSKTERDMGNSFAGIKNSSKWKFFGRTFGTANCFWDPVTFAGWIQFREKGKAMRDNDWMIADDLCPWSWNPDTALTATIEEVMEEMTIMGIDVDRVNDCYPFAHEWLKTVADGSAPATGWTAEEAGLMCNDALSTGPAPQPFHDNKPLFPRHPALPFIATGDRLVQTELSHWAHPVLKDMKCEDGSQIGAQMARTIRMRSLPYFNRNHWIKHNPWSVERQAVREDRKTSNKCAGNRGGICPIVTRHICSIGASFLNRSLNKLGYSPHHQPSHYWKKFVEPQQCIRNQQACIVRHSPAQASGSTSHSVPASSMPSGDGAATRPKSPDGAGLDYGPADVSMID